jgi:hypothetical protein
VFSSSLSELDSKALISFLNRFFIEPLQINSTELALLLPFDELFSENKLFLVSDVICLIYPGD